jgi:nitronate monooxygenase
MSFASSLQLTLACCEAGIVGGWQGGNVRSIGEFAQYLSTLDSMRRQCIEEGRTFGPPLVNFPAAVARDPDLGAQKLKLCETHAVPLILSSVGDPTELVKRVHGWGGYVIHDVATVRHAAKAINAGVDGLLLTCAGAGGLTGSLSPFAFVPKIRAMFDGVIILAGGIATGAGIAAALALGADLACMGTRFIATPESAAAEEHKQLIAHVDIDDILVSTALTDVPAHWIRQSIAAAGLDPDALPARLSRADLPNGARVWRDIWSAGQSVGLIEDVLPVATVVSRLVDEFEAVQASSTWQKTLANRASAWFAHKPS